MHLYERYIDTEQKTVTKTDDMELLEIAYQLDYLVPSR